MLSDDPFRLLYLRADLDSQNKAAPYLFVDTGSLDRDLAYLQQLKDQRPDFGISFDWTNRPAGTSTRLAVVLVLQHLGATHDLCYIHGSFGYFYEVYYGEQHDLVYWLKRYPAEAWDAPPPAPSQIAENNRFWKDTTDSVLPPLIEIAHPRDTGIKLTAWEKFNKSLHIKPERPLLALLLCSFYSRAVNDWGVQLQVAGQLPEAATAFAQATNVYGDNFSARMNLGLNTDLAAGKVIRVQAIPNLMEQLEKQLGRRGGWEEILNTDGPIDDPNFRLDLATAYANGSNQRQAVQNFHRIQALAHTNALIDLELAQLLIKIQKYTTEFSSFLPAEKGYADALTNIDAVLSRIPNQPDALFLKSVAFMQSSKYKQAIEPLTLLLNSQPDNWRAMLNRAISEFKSGQLDAAKADYDSALKINPGNYQSYYGLAEIAWQQKDKYTAMKNYQLYLSNAPDNPVETKYVTDRLQQLKSGSN